ncbi:hypothetical protein PHMEG_00029476 [Phytophthora megakarya]|uniref:Uncharacterized protein n=1 Tax=Phytophthora megakarya TaxID=4795 RepID=A0A225V3I5_9STRA|nr:hypothetical protein PHMEG_00029476 [Phytophthora megakarya]
MFDTTAGSVAMPQHKIDKAKACCSLLGRPRHVATCVWSSQPSLQRLWQQEQFLHRWQRVQVTSAMKQDLIWWFHVLQQPLLNGVSLEFFQALPPPVAIVEWAHPTAASDLRYAFQANERHLIEANKVRSHVGFDINYKELLSCVFDVHVWGSSWPSRDKPTRRLPLFC